MNLKLKTKSVARADAAFNSSLATRHSSCGWGLPRRSQAKAGEGELNSSFIPGGRTSGLRPLSRHSSLATRHSRGVALVVTLILLAVTLVMAVAFLAISRRERGSVSTETDTTTAKLAADSALASAEARMVSDILNTTNPFISRLYVSTNYINVFGFTNAAGLANVNYDTLPNNGGPLNPAQMQQNIANLFYSPRPPVLYSNATDFRYYLDLNRNGRFETNGFVTNIDNDTPPNAMSANLVPEVGDPEWIGVLEHPDSPHGPNNRFVARYCFIAVPANSLDLNHIHNQALDVLLTSGNVPVIANVSGKDSYFRNQGVGTWEINLAAFLADLNTNRWDPTTRWNPRSEPYLYSQPLYNSSFAFDDARSLVAWRYGSGNYSSLSSATATLGLSPGSANTLLNNGIDEYSLGQQVTYDTNFFGNPALPWVGAANPNAYFTSPSELFNTNKTSAQFATNATVPGAYQSTYDRYTFYRMLSQLGLESAPASGEINVNYQNAIVTYTNVGVAFLPASIAVIPNMETNLFQWQPQDFFTTAANKMLQAYSAEWYQSSPSNYVQTYYGLTEPYFTNLDGQRVTNIAYATQTNVVPAFGITNIPVYVRGAFVYTPAVNRLLQLAANIYDSSTNTTLPSFGISNYPSVFRPVFWTTNEFDFTLNRSFTNTYISGYQYVQEPIRANSPPIFTPPMEVTALSLGFSSSNVWGVPWIIGAKKGFPNFNAFEMVNRYWVERKLQFNRSDNSVVTSGAQFPYGRTYTTNQMYIMSITNYLAMEDWNSYASNYNNQVTISVQDNLSVAMGVTNSSGIAQPLNLFNGFSLPYSLTSFYVTNTWPGYKGLTTGDPSFILPLATNTIWLTNSIFYLSSTPIFLNGNTFVGPCFIPVSYTPPNYMDTNQGTPLLLPLTLLITNRLQAFMQDTHDSTGSYILDYVQIGGMDGNLNINQAIADADNAGLWSTNFYNYGGNTPYGVYSQFTTSYNGGSVPGVDNDGGGWANNPIPGAGSDASPAAQQAYFTAFFSAQNTASESGGSGTTVTNFDFSIQAPYTPTRLAVQRIVFQANDPLVHYLASDLNDFTDSTNNGRVLDNPPLNKLGVVNDRYMPWGTKGNLTAQPFGGTTPDGNQFNISYKDPLVWSSDNWDFPTNKYPNVGWLGRVHRGTPWQTVYLKSTNVLTLQTIAGGGAGARVTSTGINTWMPWTGNINNSFDAINAAPVQDRLLFDLFTAAPNYDATRGQLSVNIGADDPNNMMAGLASWSALLSGTIAFSNANVAANREFVLPANPEHQSPLLGQASPTNIAWIIQPQGTPPYPNVNPMAQIVQGINSSRTNFVSIDGLQGVFEHVGDILSVSQLADSSPFLHTQNNGVADANQLDYTISDEEYEWIPQNIMGLLTVSGTPQNPQRYVVYCYGQTLKPAANGIVASGQFFNLVTNYQVTAEFGSRAIIRIDNAPTPANPTATPHVVVEQYNPLPPD